MLVSAHTGHNIIRQWSKVSLHTHYHLPTIQFLVVWFNY